MQIGWRWGVVGEWRFHGGENGSTVREFDSDFQNSGFYHEGCGDLTSQLHFLMSVD
jgi:hypothetical protein